MSVQGLCKSFNGAKGWGFIDFGGTDVFVHIKDCLGDKQPARGDLLTFDMEQNRNKPGQMQAKNVVGGSAPREIPGPCGGSPMAFDGGFGWGPAAPAPQMVPPGPATPGAGCGGCGGCGGCCGCGGVLPSGVRHQGVVKAWNGEKGFGFASVDGYDDIFVHIVDCVDNQRPVIGDVLTFETETSQKKDGTQNMKAKNVTGGSGGLHVHKMGTFGPMGSNSHAVASGPYSGGAPKPAASAVTLPALGADGRYQGLMKAWNSEKGFGFCSVDGMPNDIFVHIADCVGTQPQVGDIVSFEAEPSQKRDGTTNFKAKSVTGGSAPLKHFAERARAEEPVAPVAQAATLTTGALDLAALQLQGAALGALPQLQLAGLGGLAGFQMGGLAPGADLMAQQLGMVGMPQPGTMPGAFDPATMASMAAMQPAAQV